MRCDDSFVTKYYYYVLYIERYCLLFVIGGHDKDTVHTSKTNHSKEVRPTDHNVLTVYVPSTIFVDKV